MTPIRIFQGQAVQDEKIIKDLFWEYLTWANDRKPGIWSAAGYCYNA